MFRDTRAELGPRSAGKESGRKEILRVETEDQQESLDLARAGTKELTQGSESEPWGVEMQAQSEKAVTELAAATANELTQLPDVPPLQRKQLAAGEFSQVVEQETQNAVSFGTKLRRVAAPILTGVGIGVAARIVAKRVVDVVAPGSSVAVGGIAGAAINSIGAYRRERLRIKGVKEYLEQSAGKPAVELAAEYVALSGEVNKNPASLEKQLRLLELAEQIHSADLKEVRGADLILKDIKIRNAADTEALGGDKQNREILQQLQAHYSTKANKATIAKAAARGAVLGSLGSVLGTAAAAYLGLGAEAVAHAEGLKQAASAAKETVPDVLPMHGTVWGTAKEFLRSQGIEPSNQNILKTVKHLTGTNDIDVAAWGEYGHGAADTAMQEGFSLKGFHEVLQTFGKTVRETATETVANESVVNAAGQVVTEHGTVLSAETIQHSAQATASAAAGTGGRGAMLGKIALLAGLVGAGGYALYKWDRSIPRGARAKAAPSVGTDPRAEAGPGPTTPPPGPEAGPKPGGGASGAEAAGAAAAGAAGAAGGERSKKKERGHNRHERQRERAEEEARRQAEQERQRAEDEKRRNDEKQKAEEEKRKADAEKQRQREYEEKNAKAKRDKQDQERRDADDQRKAKEARDKADQERQKAEQERQKQEDEARARAEEAKKQADQKAKSSETRTGREQKEQKKAKLKKIPDFDPKNSDAVFTAHKLLGVQFGASEKAIKDAWKKLVQQHHPDRWPEDYDVALNNTKNINRAKDYLLDRFKRGGGRGAQ